MTRLTHRTIRILALLALFAPAGCDTFTDNSREEEQRAVRAERLRRARAQRARRARMERLRKVRKGQTATVPTPSPTTPPKPPEGPCSPAAELKRRANSSAHNDQFVRDVGLVATGIKADLVELSGKPFQRFTFVVRMHPHTEPRFGRPRIPAVLKLELRYRRLCSTGKTFQAKDSLRVGLAKSAGKTTGVTTSLWPQRKTTRGARLPIGKPIQLLLDPTRDSLNPNTKPWGGTGIWDVVVAHFVGRHRNARLSLATSKLPDALRQLHVVEVPCNKPPYGRCRFLTRAQGRLAVVTSWKEAVQLAAPIKARERALQLHQALLSLRFSRCTSAADRRPRGLRRHPCIRGRAHGQACQYWRAFKGYGNEPRMSVLADRIVVQQMLSCPGKKLRVLQLQATYTRKGKSRVSVTDLSPRASTLLEQVRRMTARIRRRRRRKPR